MSGVPIYTRSPAASRHRLEPPTAHPCAHLPSCLQQTVSWDIGRRVPDCAPFTEDVTSAFSVVAILSYRGLL